MKTLNRVTLILVLTFALIGIGGCAYVPKTQATDETGAYLYYAIDEDGEAYSTPERVDPVTGIERQPVEIYDVDKVSAIGTKGVSIIGGVIPQPFSEIFGLVATSGLMVGGWFLRQANKKKTEALKQKTAAEAIAENIVVSIEAAKDENGIVDVADIVQPEATKAFVDSHQP